MDVSEFLKSVVDQDTAAVVICNLNHEIVYMNPSAVSHYIKYGGESLVGKNLLECHNEDSKKHIYEVIEWFLKSPDNNIVFTHHNDKHDRDVYMVALRDEDKNLIGYYEKHEYRNPETKKPYDMEF